MLLRQVGGWGRGLYGDTGFDEMRDQKQINQLNEQSKNALAVQSMEALVQMRRSINRLLRTSGC